MPIHRLLTRRDLLRLSLASLATMGAVANAKASYIKQQIQALDNPKREFKVTKRLPLKKLAAAKGLIYGCAVNYPTLLANKALAKKITQECAILTPEWELKWFNGDKPLRPSPEVFDFSQVDRMIDFVTANKMHLRGHTLVWHEGLPPWFQDKVNQKNAEQFLDKHIQTVVGRYVGRIHSWDVVNEAIAPSDGREDGLRKTPWLELLGPSYIDLAFQLTAKADPKAMLVYNDYGLEYDIPKDEAKRIAVLKLLEQLKFQGTPIHALGIQAHLRADETKFSPQKLKGFLRDVASLGLKIMITELDVADKKLPFNIAKRDRFVARAYEDFLATVLEEPAVIAVITWGLSDRYTWLSEFQPRPDSMAVRPLPLDAKLRPKLAWNAIARAFEKAPKR